MKLELLTIGDFAHVYDHSLCIMGINPLVDVHQFPCQVRFCIVCRIRFDLSESGMHKIKLWMTNEDKPIADIHEQETIFNVQEDWPVFSVTQIFNGIRVPITVPGVYSIEVSVDGVGLGSTPLCFRAVSPSQP
jgi:hypothetical protein